MAVSRRTIFRTAAAGMALGGLAPRAAVAQSTPAAPPGPMRLSANENPYGPSDSAKAAMTVVMSDGWKYATGEMGELAKLIAAREGLAPDNVLVTEGSAEVLRVAALIYGSSGQEMVAARPTFEQGPDYAEKAGGVLSWVNLDKDLKHDLAAMEARVTNRTGLVYVCNPNNPTATMVAAKDLRGFIGAVSSRAMVLVDEAYIDLVDDPKSEAMVDQVKAGKNVIIARTFSKIHGMAGLRLGFALARPDIVKRMNELRMSVPNIMGLKAGIASYQDAEFMAFSRKMIREGMTLTMKTLDELGLKHTPSQANFVFFDTGKPVREFMGAMRQKNISVGRPFAPYDTWARVSMGKLDQMQVFAQALRDHFKKA
ncbi:MAG: aminotransferase class I/II-fold pyridoxal phosphate-dependent enzyme [Rhodospirillaceae bacterium]|nr:aminotransferase class I/II-fold pyridoxal phosphate-dependent enzyme [Rhodospirillaceae bacterium]